MASLAGNGRHQLPTRAVSVAVKQRFELLDLLSDIGRNYVTANSLGQLRLRNCVGVSALLCLLFAHFSGFLWWILLQLFQRLSVLLPASGKNRKAAELTQ